MANPRERFLLAAFLAALGMACGIFGWVAFSRVLQAQNTALEQKRQKLRTLSRWLDNQEAWQAKGQWLEACALPSYAGPETEAAFVQTIQAALGRRKIEILEQRMQEARSRGHLVEVPIGLVLSAPLEELIGWLHETQQIDSFRAIIHSKFKSDAGHSEIRAEITLVQFYAKPES